MLEIVFLNGHRYKEENEENQILYIDERERERERILDSFLFFISYLGQF